MQEEGVTRGFCSLLCLGHQVYEATVGYNKGLNHGEAVLLGIMSAVEFSRKKNIQTSTPMHIILGTDLKAPLLENQEEILFACGCFWGAEKGRILGCLFPG